MNSSAILLSHNRSPNFTLTPLTGNTVSFAIVSKTRSFPSPGEINLLSFCSIGLAVGFKALVKNSFRLRYLFKGLVISARLMPIFLQIVGLSALINCY